MADRRGSVGGAVAAAAATAFTAGYTAVKAVSWADRKRHGVTRDRIKAGIADLAEPDDTWHHELDARDGGRLHVLERGPREATPIVLLHGVTLAATVWHHQLEDLSGRYRVLAPDWRGHGRSRAGKRGYGLDLLAQDLATILTTFDLRHAVLVGHSMGGMALQRFVQDHRDVFEERVAALVFQSTAADEVATGPASSVFRAGRLLAEKRPDVAGRLFQAVPGDFAYAAARMTFGTDPSPIWVEQTRQLFDRMSPRSMARSMLPLLDHHGLDVLATVDVPTLVLCGTHDLVTPLRQSEAIAAAVPGSELVTFEQAGHMLMLERRDELARVLRDFVQRTVEARKSRRELQR